MIAAWGLIAALSASAAGPQVVRTSGDQGRAPRSPDEVTTPLANEPTAGRGFEGHVELTFFQYFRQITPSDEPAAGWFTVGVRRAGKAGRFTFSGAVVAQGITDGSQKGRTVDLADRSARRPVVSLTELSVRASVVNGVDVEAGRLHPAWARTDVYSPADAFLPRDLSDPFSDERLPIWAARVEGERGPVRIEAFHAFITTPWRLPLMEGRFSPGWYADIYLNDAVGPPPRRGFDRVRVSYSGAGWDVGLWARTGVRPAPILSLDRDREVTEPYGTVIPVGRRFTNEDAVGTGVTKVVQSWILHGELAYLQADDSDVGRAILWSFGTERVARNGLFTLTVAGNFVEPPIDPLGLPDRAFLPYFIASTTQEDDWGRWNVTWLATMRRVGGILKGDVSRALTDSVRMEVGADIPHGARTSSPGALGQAKRLYTTLRWSW